MKSYEGILLGHVDPHCFVVYTTFKVFVPGVLFAGKSLETVQAKVLLLAMFTIITSE